MVPKVEPGCPHAEWLLLPDIFRCSACAGVAHVSCAVHTHLAACWRLAADPAVEQIAQMAEML